MKFLNIGGVVFGALVVTTLGINAADVLNGNSSSLLSQVISREEISACPKGMVEVSAGKTFSCVDIYEASPNDLCAESAVKNTKQTQNNLNISSCAAASVVNRIPWTYISREQAQTACLRAGKRLPTAQEWYLFSLGTPDIDTSCNITGGAVTKTGTQQECKSAIGVYDAVGNVWEWTSDDIIEGIHNGVALPDEGYVAQVLQDGIAVVSTSTPQEQFASDYIWVSKTGVFGLLRGGFYGSGSDAGVYSVQGKTTPMQTTGAIGFRCVR